MSDPLTTVHAGHVPRSLGYGPVSSRRFGRSLGVSFSDPGDVQCRWRCPYCQLGQQRPAIPQHADAEAIIDQTLSLLETLGPHAVDTVTFAGNGEPLDHPEFPRIVRAIIPVATRLGAATVLLSNGDGIGRPGISESLALIDRFYIKWDPGVRDGAWRPPEWKSRAETLTGLQGLRIQAMLFNHRDGTGNAGGQARHKWLRDMVSLAPLEIHLTTIERDPANPALRPVDAELLERWRCEAITALGIPVSVFPSRTN